MFLPCKMQPRVFLDEKDSSIRAQSRGFPSNLLKFLLLFLVLGVGFSVLSMYMTRYFRVQNVVSPVFSNLHHCYEEPYNLNRWIRPPSRLMHTMTDEELFWRASFVPHAKKYPFRRIPKVAFMFLTKGPLPLYPLWEKFLKGHERLYSIYIHPLPSYHGDFPPTSIFYRRQIPSKVSSSCLCRCCQLSFYYYYYYSSSLVKSVVLFCLYEAESLAAFLFYVHPIDGILSYYDVVVQV